MSAPVPVLVRLTPRDGASARTRATLERLGPVCCVESVLEPDDARTTPVLYVSALPGPEDALPRGWALVSPAEVDVVVVDDPALAESARRPVLDQLRAQCPPPSPGETLVFLARHGHPQAVNGTPQPGDAPPFTPQGGDETR